VAFRLMPFLLLCYFISFLDRINVAFAALQMNKAIGLSTARIRVRGWAFLPDLLPFRGPFESDAFSRRRNPMDRTDHAGLGAMRCRHGLCCRSPQLLRDAATARRGRSRLLPGCSVLPDALVPTLYRGRMVSVFMAGVAISGLLGAPISGLLVSLHGFLGISGWQWLFIIEGAPAIILAPVCLFYLQDGPRRQSGWPRPSVKSSRKVSPPNGPSANSARAIRCFRR
jgi:ACS family tartrate transporter-like MFS transporter